MYIKNKEIKSEIKKNCGHLGILILANNTAGTSERQITGRQIAWQISHSHKFFGIVIMQFTLWICVRCNQTGDIGIFFGRSK